MSQNWGIFLRSAGAWWCSGASGCNSLLQKGDLGSTGLLQPIKPCRPRPTTSSPLLHMHVDSPCSSVYLQNINWLLWNPGLVALRNNSGAKAKQELLPRGTHVFGKLKPWFQAVAPGDAQEGGQGTDLLPSVFSHTPATRGAWALIGGCILITVLNSHW